MIQPYTVVVGDYVEHFRYGIGEVVWINEEHPKSGHILVMFKPQGFWERLFPKAKDTYIGHVRPLTVLERLALEGK